MDHSSRFTGHFAKTGNNVAGVYVTKNRSSLEPGARPVWNAENLIFGN